MTQTILSTQYGECWDCTDLTTIYEFGQVNKGKSNFGREYLCKECIEKRYSKKLSTGTI